MTPWNTGHDRVQNHKRKLLRDMEINSVTVVLSDSESESRGTSGFAETGRCRRGNVAQERHEPGDGGTGERTLEQPQYPWSFTLCKSQKPEALNDKLIFHLHIYSCGCLSPRCREQLIWSTRMKRRWRTVVRCWTTAAPVPPALWGITLSHAKCSIPTR